MTLKERTLKTMERLKERILEEHRTDQQGAGLVFLKGDELCECGRCKTEVPNKYAVPGFDIYGIRAQQLCVFCFRAHLIAQRRWSTEIVVSKLLRDMHYASDCLQVVKERLEPKHTAKAFDEAWLSDENLRRVLEGPK